MFEVTESEINRLEKLETVVDLGIRRGLDAFAALKDIREERLYHARGYENFEDYCKNEWDINGNYAQKNIAAIETRERLCTIVQSHDVSRISSEFQLRELVTVPDGSLEKVIEAAEEISHEEGLDRLPARILRKARNAVVGKPAKKQQEKKPEKKKVTAEIVDSDQKCTIVQFETPGESSPAELVAEPVNVSEEKLDQSRRICLESATRLRRHMGVVGYRQFDAILVDIIKLFEGDGQ